MYRAQVSSLRHYILSRSEHAHAALADEPPVRPAKLFCSSAHKLDEKICAYSHYAMKDRMIVSEVRAFALSFRLENAPRRGSGQPIKKDMVVVRVRTKDGITGYGEAHHALAPTVVPPRGPCGGSAGAIGDAHPSSHRPDGESWLDIARI